MIYPELWLPISPWKTLISHFHTLVEGNKTNKKRKRQISDLPVSKLEYIHMNTLLLHLTLESPFSREQRTRVWKGIVNIWKGTKGGACKEEKKPEQLQDLG